MDQQEEKVVRAVAGLPKRETEALFQDTSTECAICLLPLDDDDDDDNKSVDDDKDDDNNDVTVITLTCGHRWHLHCIKQQLEHAKPNPAKRLVFTGCTCAKCGTVCSNHPALQHVSRQVDSLRQRVQNLIQELPLEIIDNDEDDDQKNENDKNATTDKHQERLDRAWKKYAFYLCANCEDPYFGGTIACADQVEGEIVESKDRLCVACRETTTSRRHGSNNSNNNNNGCCRNVAQHRSFLVWKCRYCCRPASFVCYGNVHFCESCHDRNTKRVQTQQQQPAPPLEPIPCPGGAACPFPKPNHEQNDYHVNVPTSDGEQVYGCTLCQSVARHGTPTSSSRWSIPEGSRNLIINSSGQDGLRHWQQLQLQQQQHGGGRGGGMAWQIEASDVPAVPALAAVVVADPPLLTTNFVSTFQWCSMAQHVPLFKYVRDPSQSRIEVAAQYMGRTDCPSVFRLEAVVLNHQGRVVHRKSTDILTTPQDDWDRASLILEPQQQPLLTADHAAHSLLLIVHGKDGRFWQGLFGAKVADCSVRILGSPMLLQEQMLEDDVEVVPAANHIQHQDVAWPLFQRQRRRQEPGNGGGRQVQQQLDRNVQHQHHRVQQNNPDAWNRLMQQTFLPIIVVFLLLWFLG